MAPLRFRVSEAQAGARLDRVLAEREEIDSRALAERLLASGAALVDGERRPKSHRLAGGEEIEVELPEATPLVAEAIEIPVVWEDEHLLVVDKPAGLVVHPSGGTRTGTLVHGLLELGAEGGDSDRPGIVHRLDRDTSGLLIVARSTEAHALLQELVRRREVERTYAALVRGVPQSRSGPDRGPDRTGPPRPHAALARLDHAARGGHLVRGARPASPSTRSSTCGSRPGARIRSGCTSRRSGCPCRATPSTASPATSG